MSTVYLTFDDGPKTYTPAMLDRLKTAKAVATFFFNGDSTFNQADEKACVERLLKEGHQFGNHCFKHYPMKDSEYNTEYGDLTDPVKRAAFKKNITANVDHFRTVMGDPNLQLPLVRLPGSGIAHKPSLNEVAKLGYKHVGWSFEFAPNGTYRHVDKKDWQGIAGVSATATSLPKDKAVILAHEAHWTTNPGLFADVLKKLVDNGYTFALIEQPALIA